MITPVPWPGPCVTCVPHRWLSVCLLLLPWSVVCVWCRITVWGQGTAARQPSSGAKLTDLWEGMGCGCLLVWHLQLACLLWTAWSCRYSQHTNRPQYQKHLLSFKTHWKLHHQLLCPFLCSPFTGHYMVRAPKVSFTSSVWGDQSFFSL